MGDRWLTLGEAEEYMLKQYGATWSRPTWRKYIRLGVLTGKQAGSRSWWYVRQSSIDDFFRS